MDIKIPQKIEQMFPTASVWEKIFIVNYYDGKNRILPQNKETRLQDVQRDIENSLSFLYAYPHSMENFQIDTENNPDLEREYLSRIAALKAQGDGDGVQEYLTGKEFRLKEIAEKRAQLHHDEYLHLTSVIRATEYEPAFKYLMLAETLEKTYKQDKDGEGIKTIVKKRVPHKTLANHMLLNGTILQVVHDNISTAPNFASLYFAGVGIFNEKIAQSSDVSLDGVETFGMGRWIKFEGKKSSQEKYLENAQALASLVQDTQWCTKTLAASQLAQGDFFVFVDNDGKPRVAVKMSGNDVDEVRGLADGEEQGIEEDFRKVAVEFLTKNKNIKHGQEWLEKENWNARLAQYEKDILLDNFNMDEIDNLLRDIVEFKDYKPHAIENSNKERLLLLISQKPELVNKIAEYFGCRPDEISFTGARFRNFEKNPYAVVFGISNFRDYDKKEITKLRFILGNVLFNNTALESLGEIESIHSSAQFSNTNIRDTGNLRTIFGNAFFQNCPLNALGKIEYIAGNVSFEDTNIDDLGALKRIGGSANFAGSKITSLENLEIIEGNAVFAGSQIEDISTIKFIGGKLALDERQEKLFADYIYKDEQGFWKFKNRLEKVKDNLGRTSFEETFTEAEYQ